MRNVVVCFVALALAACSTTPVSISHSQAVPQSQVLAPELQKPTSSRTERVLLVRDTGLLGSLAQTLVAVDGQDVVVLKPSQQFTFFLAPGHHMFTVRHAKHSMGEPPAENDIEIRAGGNNSFRLRLVSGDGPRIERSQQILE